MALLIRRPVRSDFVLIKLQIELEMLELQGKTTSQWGNKTIAQIRLRSSNHAAGGTGST